MGQAVTESAATETYSGKGGLKIVYRVWRPAGTPKATLVFCPGFNSHSGQYAWQAEEIVKTGLVVYAVDFRGRGKSEGERFYVEDIADYVADLAGVIGIAKERDPSLPVFVLGHSAGGVIAAVYTLDNQKELAGFICESFAFQVPAPGFLISAIKGLSHIAPRLPILTLKNTDFSRDPKAVEALNNDPLIAHETQPALTIAALARADERLHDSFEQITIPVLIMHGTEDKATVCHGSEFFYEHVGSADKTLKLYEGHYHDLLADFGKEEVLADIKTWIAARVPA
jgi:alpha-beta hydrolase superfamily lysophospholipase